MCAHMYNEVALKYGHRVIPMVPVGYNTAMTVVGSLRAKKEKKWEKFATGV